MGCGQLRGRVLTDHEAGGLFKHIAGLYSIGSDDDNLAMEALSRERKFGVYSNPLSMTTGDDPACCRSMRQLDSKRPPKLLHLVVEAAFGTICSICLTYLWFLGCGGST